MKPELEQVITDITAFAVKEFPLALNASDPGSEAPTPADLLAKRLELAQAGDKITIGYAISILVTADRKFPNVKAKAHVTLKAQTPDMDYQELQRAIQPSLDIGEAEA